MLLKRKHQRRILVAMAYREIFFFVVFLCTRITCNGSDSVGICTDGWVPYGRSCYLFSISSRVHFTEAEHYCRQRGAHLVTIESFEENRFIKDFLKRLSGHSFWMGLSDGLVEGEWKWLSNGSAPTFTDWNPGQPNNFNHKQDCVHFYQPFHYRWDDTECTAYNLPLCEKSKTLVETEIIG